MPPALCTKNLVLRPGIRKGYYTDEDGLVMFKKLFSADGEGEDDPAS